MALPRLVGLVLLVLLGTAFTVCRYLEATEARAAASAPPVPRVAPERACSPAAAAAPASSGEPDGAGTPESGCPELDAELRFVAPASDGSRPACGDHG